MFRKCLFSILLLISISQFSYCQLYAQKEEGEIIIISERVGKEIDKKVSEDSSKEKNLSFTIRLGQGGFTDNRSPLGKLGGGQLTLDIKPRKFPFAISLSNEYYTNSADPTHSYEIKGLIAVNLLYMKKIFNTERVNFFVGGGIGGLEVPKGEDEPGKMERGIVFNTEVGINAIVFWKIGFYGIYKYLYAKKGKVINFSEHIILLGLTFNFSL